ncbi:hypothetical protein [Pseudolysinimonas sp.]
MDAGIEAPAALEPSAPVPTAVPVTVVPDRPRRHRLLPLGSALVAVAALLVDGFGG